jgi:hypothetical protein
MAHPVIEKDGISTLPSARMSPASPEHLGPPRPSSVQRIGPSTLSKPN